MRPLTDDVRAALADHPAANSEPEKEILTKFVVTIVETLAEGQPQKRRAELIKIALDSLASPSRELLKQLRALQ